MPESIVNLGAGASDNSGIASIDEVFPGPVYEEGQNPPASEHFAFDPGYQQDTHGAMLMSIYEMPSSTLAEPTTSYGNPARALRVMQGRTRDGDTELERRRLFRRRANRQLRENMAAGMENPLENLFGFAGPQIAMEEGGAVEEKGIGSFFADFVTGNAPSDQLNALRESARMGDPMGEAIYGDEPTFMERLITEYGYPASIPMEDEQGFPVVDDAGRQKMMIATDFNLPEYMRTQRPRQDMPTYGELEDARAHALASAELARRYGPETAQTVSTIKESVEVIPGFGSSKFGDVAMDIRNNTVGIQLFREAGMNNSPRELARMVDSKVFEQLDIILGRTPAEQTKPAPDQPGAPYNFKSPEGGIDVYFPRDRSGFFDTSYVYDGKK